MNRVLEEQTLANDRSTTCKNPYAGENLSQMRSMWQSRAPSFCLKPESMLHRAAKLLSRRRSGRKSKGAKQ